MNLQYEPAQDAADMIVCTNEKLSDYDIKSALINALTRIAQLEKQAAEAVESDCRSYCQREADEAAQPDRASAMGAGDRDAILESAVQAVAERAGDADRMQVIAAFDAIRGLKANRFALPESIQRMRPTASGDVSDGDLWKLAMQHGLHRVNADNHDGPAWRMCVLVAMRDVLALRPTASGAVALSQPCDIAGAADGIHDPHWCKTHQAQFYGQVCPKGKA